jgi:hypothetical protein
VKDRDRQVGAGDGQVRAGDWQVRAKKAYESYRHPNGRLRQAGGSWTGES